MIHGLDTGFLVAAEVTEHVEHTGARDTFARLLSAGDLIAIAPQVLAEFIHIVTDPRRFIQPLDMTAARQLAEQWWTAREVVRVFPDDLPPLTGRQVSNRSSLPTKLTSWCSASSPASHPREEPRILECHSRSHGASSEKVKGRAGDCSLARDMTNRHHFNSIVTLSIVPVNVNGSLFVKSTTDPTSMPMSMPSPSEICSGMVLGIWPSATFVPFTSIVTAAPLPRSPAPPL